MILSHRHKFVFIKGMKVAGTSVEMALALLCGPDDIVTPISPIDERERLRLGASCRNYSADRALEADYLARLAAARPEDLPALRQPPLVYANHMPLRDVLRIYARPLVGYRVVGVERSPYAKAISWANMRLTYDRYRVGGEMRADIEALRACIDQGFETGVIRDARNIDRYRGPDGKLAAQLMRYAALQEDFGAFVRSLGVEDVPPLPHAKKGLMSDGLDPRAMLRPDQIGRINALFADEFAAFGYDRI
ncbi:MAG TPA: hypothetical protein VNU97_11275 [Rhizomicrobium sp.]|jgi:hypothetical protein|nr:hypothetical protein [Rhizomicrobium sp.]